MPKKNLLHLVPDRYILFLSPVAYICGKNAFLGICEYFHCLNSCCLIIVVWYGYMYTTPLVPYCLPVVKESNLRRIQWLIDLWQEEEERRSHHGSASLPREARNGESYLSSSTTGVVACEDQSYGSGSSAWVLTHSFSNMFLFGLFKSVYGSCIPVFISLIKI